MYLTLNYANPDAGDVSFRYEKGVLHQTDPTGDYQYDDLQDPLDLFERLTYFALLLEENGWELIDD